MNSYRNILAHSLVNLGDVVLVTGALAMVRRACPDARITFLVRPDAAELLTDHPVIDEILVWDYKGRDRAPARQLAFLRDLRRRRFDLALSFDTKLRPALLTRLAGIPERVLPERVFDNEPTRLGSLYTRVVRMPFDITGHLQADTYQELVRQFFGIGGTAAPAVGRLTPAHRATAAALLAELPAGRPRVALCLKTTHALKDWPLARFARLADLLHAETGAGFLLVGAPGQKAYADRLPALTRAPAVNLCGRTTLKELAALMEICDLLVSGCTGTVHIAATAAAPTVVLYGCSSPRRWAPLNPNASTISREPPCCPCSKLETECDLRLCLGDIRPEDVCRTALDRLAAGRRGTAPAAG